MLNLRLFSATKMKRHPELFYKGQICQRVSPEIEVRLNEAATRTGKLRSTMVREALQNYLDRLNIDGKIPA
jgi:predicted HicB family RNase H-like nuclease